MMIEWLDYPLSADIEEARLSEEECIHHWLIDPPHGRHSVGYCVKCTGVGVFFNSMESRYNNDGGSSETNLTVIPLQYTQR